MNAKFFKIVIIFGLSTLLFGCGDDTTTGKKKTGDVAAEAGDDFTAKVIYGDDNRLDLYQIQDRRLLQLANSTVALIGTSDLQLDGNQYKISTTQFAQSFRLPLCQNEPFREQDTAPFCSGFLVAPNIVVTAGHCMQTQGTPSSDCSTTRFVFGFSVKSANARPLTVPAGEVYACKRIIKHTLVDNGADYSVVELDRNVPNHAPLKLRRSGAPEVNLPLTVIGHPSGLPTKVADGARVRTLFPAYIRANLDTYGGNSGSAVFNSETLEVEGVLVRGEEDFVVQGSCMASKRCANEACRGEDVTRISEVLPYLPAASENPEEEEPTPLPTSRFEAKTRLSIPDNNETGITSSVNANEAPQGRTIKVEVNISHPWRGDLTVSLVAPDGRQIPLTTRKGRSADNLIGVYGDDLIAEGRLSELQNVSQAGLWSLKVTDRAARDIGTLNSWTLVFESKTP